MVRLYIAFRHTIMLFLRRLVICLLFLDWFQTRFDYTQIFNIILRHEKPVPFIYSFDIHNIYTDVLCDHIGNIFCDIFQNILNILKMFIYKRHN